MCAVYWQSESIVEKMGRFNVKFFTRFFNNTVLICCMPVCHWIALCVQHTCEVHLCVAASSSVNTAVAAAAVCRCLRTTLTCTRLLLRMCCTSSALRQSVTQVRCIVFQQRECMCNPTKIPSEQIPAKAVKH